MRAPGKRGDKWTLRLGKMEKIELENALEEFRGQEGGYSSRFEATRGSSPVATSRLPSGLS